MDDAEIQSIERDYYKQLYANKMDNLEEMEKFLERYNLPRLNQEEIEDMNRPITSNHIETVFKDLPTRGRRYGDICICIADSLCYKAETNTPL